MDTIKDFFSELKDRISNPLVSSFLLSWCLWNYEIPLSLIFYTHDQIKWDGYRSFYGLVNAKQDTCRMIVWPLIIAIIYTAGFPFVKAGVRILNSWLTSWTDTDILKRTKHHVVPVELHMEVVNSLDELKERYVKLITSQSTTEVKNLALTEELQRAKQIGFDSYKELTDMFTKNLDIKSADLRLSKGDIDLLSNNLREKVGENLILKEKLNALELQVSRHAGKTELDKKRIKELENVLQDINNQSLGKDRPQG